MHIRYPAGHAPRAPPTAGLAAHVCAQPTSARLAYGGACSPCPRSPPERGGSTSIPARRSAAVVVTPLTLRVGSRNLHLPPPPPPERTTAIIEKMNGKTRSKNSLRVKNETTKTDVLGGGKSPSFLASLFLSVCFCLSAHKRPPEYPRKCLSCARLARSAAGNTLPALTPGHRPAGLMPAPSLTVGRGFLSRASVVQSEPSRTHEGKYSRRFWGSKPPGIPASRLSRTAMPRQSASPTEGPY